MSRSCMTFFKGLGLGVAAGMTAGVFGCSYWKHHRRGLKKNMSRALRNMSDLVESVNGMF